MRIASIIVKIVSNFMPSCKGSLCAYNKVHAYSEQSIGLGMSSAYGGLNIAKTVSDRVCRVVKHLCVRMAAGRGRAWETRISGEIDSAGTATVKVIYLPCVSSRSFTLDAADVTPRHGDAGGSGGKVVAEKMVGKFKDEGCVTGRGD